MTSTSRLPVLPPDAEKNSDSSRIAEKSATVAATMAVWPTSPSALAGVLEHGHDQPQRRRRERDRQQQRAAAPSRRRASPSPIGTPRARVIEIAEQREPQQPPAQAVRVDLQPGQEQQERQPDERRGSAPAGRPSPSPAPTGRARCRRRSRGRRLAAAVVARSRAAAEPRAATRQTTKRLPNDTSGMHRTSARQSP